MKDDHDMITHLAQG